MAFGAIGLVMILGLVAALVLVVVGIVVLVTAKQQRWVGAVLLGIGLVMLLGGAGMAAFFMLQPTTLQPTTLQPAGP